MEDAVLTQSRDYLQQRLGEGRTEAQRPLGRPTAFRVLPPGGVFEWLFEQNRQAPEPFSDPVPGHPQICLRGHQKFTPTRCMQERTWSTSGLRSSVGSAHSRLSFAPAAFSRVRPSLAHHLGRVLTGNDPADSLVRRGVPEPQHIQVGSRDSPAQGLHPHVRRLCAAGNQIQLAIQGIRCPLRPAVIGDVWTRIRPLIFIIFATGESLAGIRSPRAPILPQAPRAGFSSS